ncbi:aspartate aminotransferase family protein [Sinorhizobium mexicanum]|uniref:Aspartate aminotransferase family protein n=1 Tax=Sinorhizobium mexicanum TaxID=375549 RepID=A0A859QIK0_9HYPH|nr:aspartate aminotransferase family protein [Sinorhizobium mexicanum]MBP1884741.1 glutamate-1-semialdehyde 2,1-aminomutase [Sinorhizobium mexicanum]QLL65622.1 aspartate aminotransferase family protein [Sinorhizobium mexicanum]
MLVQATNRLRQPTARSKSRHLFHRAKAVFPDGTTRATVERDPLPIYVERGEGAYLVDVDGNRFLDLNNFTTLIHGHGFAPVSEAVVDLMRSGTCFANPTEHEIALAELLTARIPAIEHVRFVNSGTEAVMFAIKAARAFTGRHAIARIEGAYHGAYDWAEAGQGVAPGKGGWDPGPTATPAYRGTPPSVADEVHLLRFNDVEGLERRLGEISDRIACVLIDPMPSRAGLIHPEPAFIEALSNTARKYGILILADEVLNLRQSYGGASARYGLTPDLITAGKIIGGGFPIGAIGGRAEVMRVFGSDETKPLLPQGGTFSANPVSMVAGRVAMEAMTQDAYDRLEQIGDRLRDGLQACIARHEAAFSVTGAASLFRIHPKRLAPREFRDAYLSASEAALMRTMGRQFLELGILLPRGAAACLSTAMTDSDIDLILNAFDEFLATEAKSGKERPQ